MRELLVNVVFLTVLAIVCCTPDEPTLEVPTAPHRGGASSVATYYVDDAIGNNGYAGTSAELVGDPPTNGPWETIEHAISTVVANDVIYVADGTYQPTNRIILPRGKSGLSLIATGDNVIIDGSLGTKPWDGRKQLVWLQGDGQTIDGFIIQKSHGYGITASGWEGSPDVIADDCTISNCTIRHNRWIGLSTFMTENSTITGCNIWDNGWEHDTNDDVHHGVYIMKWTNNLEFTYNKVHGNADTQMHVNGRESPLNEGSNYINIRNCQFYNIYSYAGDFHQIKNSIFENNLIIGAGWGTSMESENNIYRNNTIINPDRDAALGLEIDPDNGAANYETVFNNIFVSRASPGVSNETGTNYIDEDSNVFVSIYDSGGLSDLFKNYVAADAAADPSSPSDTPYELQGDYSIKYGSDAHSDRDHFTTAPRGIPYYQSQNAPSTDIDGNSRPTPNPGGKFDIGAYELNSGNFNWGSHFLQPNGDIYAPNGQQWTAVGGESTLYESIDDDPHTYAYDTSIADTYITTTATNAGQTDYITLDDWSASWPDDTNATVNGAILHVLASAAEDDNHLRIQLYQGNRVVWAANGIAQMKLTGGETYSTIGGTSPTFGPTPAVFTAVFTGLNRTTANVDDFRLQISSYKETGADGGAVNVYAAELELHRVSSAQTKSVSSKLPHITD
jgi:parallel beta-helix repeat protein